MSDELVRYEGSLIERDDVVAIAEQAERRLAAVLKIKNIALKATNAGDWVDQNGKPYLMTSGAEKVAGVFNISWRFLSPEPMCERDADGHFTYTYRAEFSMGGRTIEAEGSRSSKDKFFSQYVYEGKERSEKAVSDRDNERDVKMAAYTNLLGNGITRILGIRNLTYADLMEFAGISQDQIGKVEYKKKNEPNKPPISAPQEKTAEVESVISGVDNVTVSHFKKKDGSQGTKYIIHAGEKYETFSETIATEAKRAKEAGLMVTITYKTDAYGRKIDTFTVQEPRTPGAEG